MPASSVPFVAAVLAMFAAFTIGMGYASIRQLFANRREALEARRATPAQAPKPVEFKLAA